MLDSLSPQRRRTLLAMTGLLLAVGAVGVLFAVVMATHGARAYADQSRPGPVLLVPGYGGQLSSLDDLAGALRAAGRTAIEVPLPDGALGDIGGQARALDDAVRRAERSGAPSVDLVGYSAGGIVVRTWVARFDGRHRARRIVTLGSPNHGTSVAALAAALAAPACTTACQQLAPDSALLDELDRGDETPDGPRWLSVWTTDDQTVTPPDTARLAGARNVTVQSLSPGDRVDHSGLPRDPVVVRLVVDDLDGR